MTTTMSDQDVIQYLRGLILDGVDKAKSGHPGGPLSCLDFAYVLFTEFLRFDPEDVKWAGRDRFILSAGHASMLQYALLQAMGHLKIDDLKRFRQLHSKTPGHPENIVTPGVECSTGPLGQGCAMSVGFAIAAAHLGAAIDAELYAHRTWVILGDGCMQEDVTLGAASLAGHLKLSNLIWFYDRNAIQISGSIDRCTSDDEEKIFEGFGWRTIKIDGHDHAAIRQAIQEASLEKDRPTLIIGHTQIGHGLATMAGSHKTHGSPVPNDELRRTKQLSGLPEDQAFLWPPEAKKHFQRNFAQRRQEVAKWRKRFESEMANSPDFKKRYDKYFSKLDVSKLPSLNWQQHKSLATRSAFGQLIENWCEHIPNLIGGSADLEPSNVLEGFVSKVKDFSRNNRLGRNIVYGVREFPMSAINNGIALHGGFIPFDATFLVFSDYARPALRLGALQRAQVIHEYTHDSFYLGEDGPTHQPIEHLMSLRLMPDLYVMRPADALETEVLLRHALSLSLPSCFALTRQNLPHLPASREELENAKRGAWIVRGKEKKCDMIIFASGSEVSLALAVADVFANQMSVRVVSIPCWELFFEQGKDYIKSILEPSCAHRVSIEAGSTLGWERFVGMDGLCIGIDSFGESAPAEDLAKLFGFTAEAVVTKVDAYIARAGK